MLNLLYNGYLYKLKLLPNYSKLTSSESITFELATIRRTFEAHTNIWLV